MKERPILMSAPMVRAILAGSKTQTRRVVKPTASQIRYARKLGVEPSNEVAGVAANACLVRDDWSFCPYGEPGDRLWVRETFIASKAVGGYMPGVDPDTSPNGPTIDVIYRADNGPNERFAGPWTPSIHMPRIASRITLEIVSVRVERLQDISEADALAEGIGRYDNGTFGLNDPGACMGATAVIAYMRLWNHINGPDSWSANPWVWAIEFRRL